MKRKLIIGDKTIGGTTPPSEPTSLSSSHPHHANNYNWRCTCGHLGGSHFGNPDNTRCQHCWCSSYLPGDRGGRLSPDTQCTCTHPSAAHTRYNAMEGGRYGCTICHCARFDETPSRRLEPAGSWGCADCNAVFSSRDQFSLHLRLAHSNRPSHQIGTWVEDVFNDAGVIFGRRIIQRIPDELTAGYREQVSYYEISPTGVFTLKTQDMRVVSRDEIENGR